MKSKTSTSRKVASKKKEKEVEKTFKKEESIEEMRQPLRTAKVTLKNDPSLIETPLGIMRAPMSESYRLMLDYMNHVGPIPFAFESYDNMFTYDIPLLFKRSPIELKDGTHILYEYETFARPVRKTREGKEEPLMPAIAKLENINYSAQIFIAAKHFKGNKLLSEKKGIPFVLPVMVNSSLCNLRDLTPDEKLFYGSDPNDPGGYFILVPGTKQVTSEPRQSKDIFLLNKDSLIKDMVHIFMEKTNPVAKITISTLHGTQQITVIEDVAKASILNARVALKENRTVNVLSIFYILDQILGADFNLEETVNLITSLSNPLWRRNLEIALSPTIGEFRTIANPIKYFSDKMGVSNIALYEEEVMTHVKNVVFPTTPDFSKRKVEMANIVVRLLEYMIRKRELDDRDHWGNKRIDTAGYHIMTLFTTLFTRIRRDVQNAMNQRVIDIRNIESCTVDAFNRHISEEIHKAFTGAKWGPSNSYRSNAQYVEPMPTNGTLITIYSLISGVKKPTKNKVDPHVRQVKASSFGYVCVDSPEGGTIGLKLFFTILATVSINRNPEIIKKYFEDAEKLNYPTLKIMDERNEEFGSKIFLNGIFLGYGRGILMEKTLRDMKRKNILPKDIRIVFEEQDSSLYLDVGGGRALRPLLVIEDDELVIDKKNLWKEGMTEILRQGAIELIDPLEQKSLLVSPSIDTFRKRKQMNRELRDKLEMIKKNNFTGDSVQNYRGFFDISTEENRKKTIENLQATIEKDDYEINYSYCELDPNALLGYTGALVPLANRNPVPRIIGQMNMGRQAVGRVSKVQHLLFNRSTIEIMTTKSFEQVGLEDQLGQWGHSFDQPLNMLIRPSDNEEDSTELNRSSIDRGLFHFTEYYSSKASETSLNGNIIKYITKPDLDRINENKRKFYRNVGDDGVVLVNSIVEEGDVLISCTRENTILKERKEIPVTVRKGEGGQVDAVHVAVDNSGNKTISVKVRQQRIPIIGDKFQMSAAQKGVVGRITPEEDLPFVIGGNPDMLGMKPDLIINAHAFPSRMTVGAFLEQLEHIIGIKTGTAMDVSAFQEELTLDRILTAMKRLKIPNKGSVKMANGKTGRPLELENPNSPAGSGWMFMLPISYKQLKHVTHNKMQARGTGARKLDTRQPVGGRQREGATRFGRMEADVFASHGIRANLADRLCESSDAFDTVICSTCGKFSIVDHLNKRFKCTVCKKEHATEGFKRTTIPFIAVNIAHQLAAAGVNMGINFGESYEGQIVSKGYEEV